MKLPILSLATLAAALVSTTAAETDTKPQPAAPVLRTAVHNIGVQEFEKLRANQTNVVLDVRTPREYAAGHMPHAVNIDFNSPQFEQKIRALDPKKTYLVHCAVGGRSAKACQKLSTLSFQNLYNLEGGFKAWEKAGNKAEH